MPRTQLIIAARHRSYDCRCRDLGDAMKRREIHKPQWRPYTEYLLQLAAEREARGETLKSGDSEEYWRSREMHHAEHQKFTNAA
jgi:hypothetical protein